MAERLQHTFTQHALLSQLRWPTALAHTNGNCDNIYVVTASAAMSNGCIQRAQGNKKVPSSLPQVSMQHPRGKQWYWLTPPIKKVGVCASACLEATVHIVETLINMSAAVH